MTKHSWHCPDLTPFSPGLMTCRRCGAITNNAFLADLHPCPEPAVTDDTPMEAGPLHVDGSHDEQARAQLIERNRRLMRREYARTFAHVHPLPRPEPVLEHSGFAPRSEDDAQAEFLAKRDPVKDSFWHGVTVGAVVALAAVAVLTVAILVWGFR